MEGFEQREKRRVKVAIRAGVVDPRSGERYPCLIRDGSISGCKIVSSTLDELPDDIYVAVPSLDQTIRGRIVWRSEKTAGVEFLWERTRNERRRGAPRQEVVINAIILDRKHNRITDCVIRDASKTGCRIATENASRLPDDICIRIDGLPDAVMARVVWRDGDRAGLEFFWDDEVQTLDNYFLV